jgi:hypothetical protein
LSALVLSYVLLCLASACFRLGWSSLVLCLTEPFILVQQAFLLLAFVSFDLKSPSLSFLIKYVSYRPI